MKWFENEFVPWLRKWWKWILFPVGIAGVVLTAIAGSREFQDVTPDRDRLDEAINERDKDIKRADEIRDVKLQELAEQHKDRLDDISEDQEKELLELADKPISEVVKWFDKL